MRLTLTLGLAAALLAAPAAGAQQESSPPPRAHVFHVTPRFGYIRFDKASSIEGAPHVALQTDYALTPHLSIGLAFGSSQPETHAEDFLQYLRFGDTTRVFSVRQSLSVIDYGAHASWAFGDLGRLAPYVGAGAGFYTIYLDPQVRGGESRVTKPMYALSAGTNIRVAGRAGVLLDVRDLVFSSYDRNRLYPATPADFPYIEDVARPTATKSTVHNLVFSIGFSFTPRLGGGDTSDEGDDR